MKNAFLFAFFVAAAALHAQTPNFKEQQIDGEVGIGYGLAVADVNGDRLTDILLADSNVIVWYENPTWKKHVIAENLHFIPPSGVALFYFDRNDRAIVNA